jgi:hypothetical protein
MADPKPYHLRNVDIEGLDLSKHENDFSPEELDAVKQALIATRDEHVANYEALPVMTKAGIYANEKFGQVGNYVEENPESLILAPLAVAGAKKVLDVGKSVFGSLREKMAAPLPDDGLLAEQLKTQSKAQSAPEVPKPVSSQTPPPAVTTEKTFEQLDAEYQELKKQGEVTQREYEANKKAFNEKYPPATPSLQSLTAEQLDEITSPKVVPPEAGTQIGKAPKGAELVEASAINKAKNEAASAMGTAPPPVAKKTPVKPVVYKSATDIPEGMVFRPDVGNLDRSLVNTLGTEGRLHAKELINEGKMFGSYQGDPKLYNQKVSELVNQYSTKLKETLPSIDLTTREGRIAAGLPHEKNYGAALGKAAKVGGVVGTLMTVAQSANAREALGNVAEAIMPIGITPSTLEPGTLYTPEQQKAFTKQLAQQQAAERQKLGSPFRSVPPPR